MENEIIGEQPEKLDNNVQNINVEENNENGTSLESEKNGSLGKFKDAESLLSAYNNLQAEFTRKCQKLSELSKNVEDNSATENVTEAEKETPVYSSENWKEQVYSFLQNNAEAKEYSGDICNEILKDENLQKSPSALELAWARVMKKNYALPTTLAKDENFINEKILSQESVKEKVLKEYFENLQKVKTPPVIASSGKMAFASAKEPKNMGEAKLMVEKLFNIKG